MNSSLESTQPHESFKKMTPSKIAPHTKVGSQGLLTVERRSVRAS